MNDSGNKKSNEELAEETLDAVTGGVGISTTPEDGVVSIDCNCGTIISVPKGATSVQCPGCGRKWRINGKVVTPAIL